MLTLIIDTTTDKAQNNYLISYFRLFINNYPVVYFYRLLLLKSKKLRFAFKEYGIENLLKSRLIGFGSDGASVMCGLKTTKKLFIEYVFNSLR